MTADDNRHSNRWVNAVVVLCAIIPIAGLVLCALTANPLWLLLLAPGVVWHEGFVALVVLAMIVWP